MKPLIIAPVAFLVLCKIELAPSLKVGPCSVQSVRFAPPTAFVSNYGNHHRLRDKRAIQLRTNPSLSQIALRLSAPNKVDEGSSTKEDDGPDDSDNVTKSPEPFFISAGKSFFNTPKEVIPKNTPNVERNTELVENIGKAALQMGSDFLVALRWGAANALTASLPEDQRQILLERMDPEPPPELARSNIQRTNTVVEEDDYFPKPNSVNEAVVAALATKSQRDQQVWEKEKEEILKQAEVAVQQRVANELAVQKQRWEEEQKRREIEAVSDDDAKDEDDEDGVADGSMDVIAPAEHAVLGTPLYDFGYKRLHLVPADVLATIPVWKKQRTYRHERARSMSVDKMKSLHLGFPGVICIHEERDTGKLCIIDGQHRVGMMKILQEKQLQGDNNSTGLSSVDLDHILVEVFTETESISSVLPQASSSSVDHAQELFTEINKAEPVKLVDMPGVATAKERKMISQSCAKLEEKYSVMFSPSQKCRPPNVNVDNLRDTIFASNILKRHSIQTSTQLYDWILQQNGKMGEKYRKDARLQASLNDKVWNKAKTNEFYLGLDSSWLYN
jgi:hypothetical protein